MEESSFVGRGRSLASLTLIVRRPCSYGDINMSTPPTARHRVFMIGSWIGIGVGVGAAVGVAAGAIAQGVALGAALGVALSLIHI